MRTPDSTPDGHKTDGTGGDHSLEKIDHSRRSFIAGTLATAAAGALLTSCASTGGRGSSYKKRRVPVASGRVPLAEGEAIRMAIIGTGGMGGGHQSAFTHFRNSKQENLEIVALCDVNKVRLNAAHARAEKELKATVDTHSDYRDILARDDIHAVLIAAPEHWHYQMAVDAIAAGKDVYLEKPMTLYMDDALHLREVVLANPDTIFQVGTQKMILPKWQEAKRLIEDNAIGKPVFSQTSYCRNSKIGEWNYYHIDPDVVPGENLDWDAWCGPAGTREFSGDLLARWRRYREFSTGIVGDLLVHEMTPLMMALNPGWPTRITASGGHYIDKKMENHDQVNLTVEFETEHTMIVAGSTCNEIGLETMIRGHHATMYLNGRNVVIRPERLFVDEIDEQTVECESIGNDQDALRHNWLECIRTREAAVSGVDLATKMMVAVALATKSMWEGKAYTFDPETKDWAEA